MNTAVLISLLELLVLVSLVGLTAWYARSTANTVKHLRAQQKAIDAQSKILSISAQVAAWTALTSAAKDVPGQSPIRHLRRLANELNDLSKASESEEL